MQKSANIVDNYLLFWSGNFFFHQKCKQRKVTFHLRNAIAILDFVSFCANCKLCFLQKGKYHSIFTKDNVQEGIKMFGGMNFFPEAPRPFKTQYKCYSVSMLPGNERDDLEHGGKIILPPSALDQLTRLNIQYPMLFKLTNTIASRTTHCGVLEFVADEGKVYIPYWMMQNLALDQGGLLTVESANLQVATYAKFQPHSVDFIDLTNPKAVLESKLRNFACLSTGDVIAICYNNKVLHSYTLSNGLTIVQFLMQPGYTRFSILMHQVLVRFTFSAGVDAILQKPKELQLLMPPKPAGVQFVMHPKPKILSKNQN